MIDGCPHAKVAHQRVVEAVDDRPDVAITVTTVRGDDDAPGKFRGSPTILIDGEDPFPGGDPSGSPACRLYRTDAGTDGAPSVDQIRRAVDGPP